MQQMPNFAEEASEHHTSIYTSTGICQALEAVVGGL